MTPPRWSTRYSDEVRAALTRTIDAGDAPARPPVPPHRSRLRFVVAIVIALVLVVPASVAAVVLADRAGPAGGSPVLSVATDGSYRYDPRGDYAGVVGRLEASRHGDLVCFRVATVVPNETFGSSPYSLVLPAGYHATASLDLLDEHGAVVASDGDDVAVYTMPSALGRTPEGCSAGTALGALHVRREAAPLPTSTPAPSTREPASAGCAPTPGEGVPAGAETGVIDDVDGDHRPDTEWAYLLYGTIRFGITTASGATVTGAAQFAGGGDRTFVVGHLANGVVVVLPSEGRSTDVLTFADCALHQAEGRNPNLPSVGSSFTLFAKDGGGDAMCVDGDLYSVSFESDGEGGENVLGQRVRVSADGTQAGLVAGSHTIASHLQESALRRYQGISCGDAPVLRPPQLR